MCRCDKCGASYSIMYHGRNGMPLCGPCYDVYLDEEREEEEWNGCCDRCGEPIKGAVYRPWDDTELYCEDCYNKFLAGLKEAAGFGNEDIA